MSMTKREKALLLIDESSDHPKVQEMIREFRQRPGMSKVSDGEAIAALTRELLP